MTSSPLRDDMEDYQAKPNRDIFQDPTIQEAIKTDAFARFIVRHWRSLVAVLVAGVLAMIAANIFTTTAVTKRASATAELLEVQKTYRTLVETQDSIAELKRESPSDSEVSKETSEKISSLEKNVVEIRTKLSHMIDSLESPEPFPVLASLYRGLVAARFNDADGLNKALDQIDGWKSLESESSERYVAELAALGVGRAALQIPELKKRGQEALKALASEGVRVGVDALVTLSYVTTDSEERKGLKSIYDTIKVANQARSAELSELASRMSW